MTDVKVLAQPVIHDPAADLPEWLTTRRDGTRWTALYLLRTFGSVAGVLVAMVAADVMIMNESPTSGSRLIMVTTAVVGLIAAVVTGLIWLVAGRHEARRRQVGRDPVCYE